MSLRAVEEGRGACVSAGLGLGIGLGSSEQDVAVNRGRLRDDVTAETFAMTTVGPLD
ncbi:hypothetical protein ACFY0B_39570 [Streptomyces sp. NPDC001797]|uniref:Uncharacterized protein n=1 Tax=Streptomyces sp. 900105755 TaxID=3154389 RepID=A0ABV1TR71_9ACTN